MAASALGALALLAAAASSASAAWTVPFNLSAPGHGAIQPAVAAGEAAGAVFAWQLAGPQGVAQTRVRSWAGARSATQDLSVAGGFGAVSFEPDAAVDASGGAVYAWGTYTQGGGSEPRVQARARSADGALSPIQHLSPSLDGVEDIQVDVDADGDAVFVWEADMGTHHQIQARTRSAEGVRGPLLELTPPGQDATEPQVAIDADGDAIFAWQRLDGTRHRADGRALSAAGVLEPTATQLSSSRWTSITPDVAVNPVGDALFVWRSTDPNGLGSGRIEMRARLASGTYTRRQTVADATGDATDPRVAIADDGSSLFAWRRSTPTRQWIKLRARSALGALGQEHTVTRALAPGSLSAPRLSLDAGGDAVVAWEVANPSVSPCCLVQARTRSAAGVFGGVTTVTTAGSQSALASDADGDAALVWTRRSGDGGRVQAAVGP